MRDFRAARSWLFVPGDSERKLAKVWSAGADAVIVDLEDAVLPENKARARSMIGDTLAAGRASGALLAVRINALQTGLADDDLAAVLPARPDAVIAPKVSDKAEMQTVLRMMAEVEERHGLEASASVLPIATETPRAIFHLDAIASAHARVAGILWGMEDLGAELGVPRTRGPDGRMLELYRTVRALALLAGAGAGGATVDTPFVDFSDAEGLAREAAEAREMGFSGKLAIHPGQVAAINAAFSPSPDEIAEAREILRLSREGGGAAFRFRGRMIDTPHLRGAERLLSRVDGQNA